MFTRRPIAARKFRAAACQSHNCRAGIIGKLITLVVLLTSDLINSIIKIAHIKSAGGSSRADLSISKEYRRVSSTERRAVGFNVNHSEFYEMYRWHAPRSNALKNILRLSRSQRIANCPPNWCLGNRDAFWFNRFSSARNNAKNNCRAVIYTIEKYINRFTPKFYLERLRWKNAT